MNKAIYKLDYDNVLYPDCFSKIGYIPEAKQTHFGTYAQLRGSYLKKHNKSAYYRLLTRWELSSYLSDIEEKAEEMEDGLVLKMAEEYGVTEELKELNRYRWISMMNSIKKYAREIVIKAMIEV